MKVTVIPMVIGALGKSPKGFLRELEELEIGKWAKTIQTRDIKIGQNTEKSPGDLRLAVTQTPLKNHQLKLMWKTLKE